MVLTTFVGYSWRYGNGDQVPQSVDSDHQIREGNTGVSSLDEDHRCQKNSQK